MLVVYIILTLGITEVFGTICLKCDDVPLPNLCEEVIECGPHELCSTEAFVSSSGTIKYKLGCLEKQSCRSNNVVGKRDEYDDILTCLSCCNKDICNAAACGSTGFSDQFGPVCYKCPLQLGSSTCNKIALCDQNEECGIQHVSKLGAPDNLFETKCFQSNACDTVNTLHEFSCCNSTLCNNNDPRTTTTQTTPIVTTQTSSTTQKTTTTTATTTTTTQTTTSTTMSTTTQPATVKVCEDKIDAICYPETCHLQTPYLVENCTKTCGFCKTDSLCEDKIDAICYPETCHLQTPYLVENCTKTCGFCNTVTSTTVPILTKAPTTIQQQTTTSTSRPTTSTTLHRPTTQAPHVSLRPDAIYDLYCDDIITGCNSNFDVCHANPDWSKLQCRESCGYCYTDPSIIVG